MGSAERGSVEHFQDVAHGDGHDYTVGSPHLRHSTLRKSVESRIMSVVTEYMGTQGNCAVLEIGAGHGSFTETAVAAGGSATITEMSKASSEYLRRKFDGDPNVRVVYDEDGNAPFNDEAQYDVIMLISVVHHIPDYISVIARLCDQVMKTGGTLITFQDPVWYPRQKATHRFISQFSYFAWRLTRGELKRGLLTRWRRFRGIYSDSERSDLVEYHVVRQGVDDLALRDLLRSRFKSVDIDYYFSTQSPQIQRALGNRLPANTFGIIARGFNC
ncbi:class I SAM-dependent methyltransferase [Mycolicibacterium sp. 3033]|nr:class I SAM-dependent methyltransferase [Mycolicibacterium aurantiacum]